MIHKNTILSHNTDVDAFENILKEKILKQSKMKLVSLDGLSEELCTLPVSTTKDLYMPTDLTDGCIGGEIKIILKNSIYDLNIHTVSYNAYDYINNNGEISSDNLKILRNIFRDTTFHEFISCYKNTFNKAYNIEYTAKHLQKELDIFSMEDEIFVYSDIPIDFFEQVFIFYTELENEKFKYTDMMQIENRLKKLNIPYTILNYKDFKGI